MSEQKSRAEELYNQGLMTAFSSESGNKSDSEKAELKKRAVSLLTEALNLGLPPAKEIACHSGLGTLFFDLGENAGELDPNEIRANGLDKFPLLSRSLSERERALSLDAQTGGRVLGGTSDDGGKRRDLYLLLCKLGHLWTFQSAYLRDKHGVESQASYLLEKMKMLEYLGGSYLPDVCFALGDCYARMNNKDAGISWFRRAIEADDFGDVDRESFEYGLYQSRKQAARDNIEYLASPSENTSEKTSKGGCFIATAVYGSPLAPEVLVFRSFRDKVLLTSKIGAPLVELYYRISPPLASLIARTDFLRSVTRQLLLAPILRLLKATKIGS